MGQTTAEFLTGGLVVSVALSIPFAPFRALVLIFGALTLLHNKFGNGLARFPGPFWASTTNFWRLREAYTNGDKRPTIVQLHDKYGDVVRLGPKALSFASPDAIDEIYGPKANMAKSKWYMAFEAHGKGEKKENIFSTRDIHWHARYRELVKPGFSINHVGHKEDEIDDLIKLLLQQFDEQTDKAVDLPGTLQYFTFDAGGVFAFSRPYGFLKKRFDIDGIIQSVRSGSTHLNRLAQVPFFQMFLDQNPLAKYFGFIAPPMAFAKKYLPEKRIDEEIVQPSKDPEHYDILDAYLAAHKTNPGVVTRNEIVDLGLMVVVPASEAVRTAMSVLVFQLLKHPAALAKMQQELDGVYPDHSGTIPSWGVVSTQLPYLDACIKETFRIHPSTGFLMERIVPAGGAVVCGRFVPAGTAVGCLPWVIHRHKPTFGDDVDAFRPERWLEASPKQRERMEKFLCPFGFGSRLCLGRDIGLFETYKIAATLFNRYKISLENPDQDMHITWGNIVSVDFRARLERR
ncbi:Cytochrome p450 [Lasiodiplodia theobromae]|uniref:Cytochrome p450 n=1 Tax=Lasiodiplodia theobromae TaxID=45133 RepID=UPI0015C3608C|nr:Cytochrome p450 [Lasiodiplodia theobromae]KAF4537431.1 Cytochrome p450 [Lasiodiplodia theobromae]